MVRVQTSIVLFSKRTLLAEAIASRLHQHLPEANLQIIAPDQLDAVDLVAQTNPTAVILDAADVDVFRYNPITTLLQLFPTLKIICLSLQQEQVQIVSSQLFQPVSVKDLLEYICPAQTRFVESNRMEGMP
ncbi:MAG: hypothetical protein Kow0031_18100 [Anaerolineae bacterium]